MSEAVINTLEAPGEFDALVKLRPNEPYFLLIGRDRHAPKLVCDWADLNRRRALADFDEGHIDKDKLTIELKQSTEAEMIAAGMRSFKAGHDAEFARSERESYTGHTLDEETAKRDALQRARVRSASALHNAVGELDAALGPINDIGDLVLRSLVEEGLAKLQALAEAVTPKRPGLGKAA